METAEHVNATQGLDNPGNNRPDYRETQLDKESTVTTTTQSESSWGPAIAAAVGAFVGDNFNGRNNHGNGHGHGHAPAATPDQVAFQVQGLRETIQGDAISAGLAGLSAQLAGVNANTNTAVGTAAAAVSCAVGGVKDAVVAGSQQAALAHCNLGNQMAQGFASVNTSMATHFGELKNQMLQQALDAERTRATELRIELSEHRNASGHQNTQILLNQVLAAGKA